MSTRTGAGARGSTPGVVGPVDVERGNRALAALVGDVSPFLAGHWGQAPVVRTGDAAAALGLLSIADIDELLRERAPRLPVVRLVRDGAPIPPARFTMSARIGSQNVADLLDPAAVSAEFAAGATISLQGLHRYWPPLTELCEALEAALTHPFQANAYLSPAAATGLRVHHDTHDVFVVQVEGSKHFDVYEPATWLPVTGQHWTSDEPPGEPVLSVDLKPGDCLYMPRGWRHRAYTTTSHSLHLTIGQLGYTWLGLASVLSADLAGEPEFREPLPAGFAHDPAGFAAEVAQRLAALRRWLDAADPAQVAETLTRRFVTGRRTTPASIAALVQAVTIAADTQVRRRRYARCLLRTSAGRIELVLADRTVSFPDVAADVVRAIVAASSSFTAAALPDTLDAAGRLVVVRRLVREGLLEAA